MRLPVAWAQALLSERPQAEVAVLPWAQRPEAAEVLPSVQPAAEAEQPSVAQEVEAVRPSAQQAAVEVLPSAVLAVAEALRAVEAAAVRPAVALAEVALLSEQPVAQALPSEARAVRLSAVPSARSDLPERLARRRMTTSRREPEAAKPEWRRWQSSSAE